jgi:hypothetical protein
MAMYRTYLGAASSNWPGDDEAYEEMATKYFLPLHVHRRGDGRDR